MPDWGNTALDDWDGFVDGLRNGEPEACHRFWSDFGNAMKQLADRRISPALQRRVDSEDVVQSVCRTFFRRAHQGQFLVEDENSLWRLLCAITVAKTRMHVRHHKRKRRDVSAEQHIDHAVADGEARVPELAGSGTTPEEQVEFADQFHHLMDQLDQEERQVLDLRLQQLPNSDIADQLGCSERTVRRIVNRLKEKMETEMNTLLR